MNLRSNRSFPRAATICAFIAFVCAPAISKAGHFAVEYKSAGSFSVTNGSPATKAYSPNPDGSFTGTATYTGTFYSPGSNGSTLLAEGEITAHVLWVQDSPDDMEVAPENILVVENCTAKFSSSGVTGPGSVDSEIGAEQIAPDNGQWVSLVSSGRRVTSKSGNAASDFEVSLSPRISVGGVFYPSSSSSADGEIKYSIQVYPVTLDIVGTVRSAGKDTLSVGQKLAVTVNTHGYTSGVADTFGWAEPVDGRPFENYVVSDASAIYTPFSVPPITSSSLSCYFAKSTSAGTGVVCVYHNGESGAFISLTRKVFVQSPSRGEISVTNRIGVMKLFSVPGDSINGYDETDVTTYVDGNLPLPNRFGLYGSREDFPDDNTYETWGIYLNNKLYPPSIFNSQTNKGTWQYAQLAQGSMSCDTTQAGGTLIEFPFSGLDAGFPYLHHEWRPANGEVAERFEDSPRLTVSTAYLPNGVPFIGTVNVTFSTYLFYCPPSNAAGPSVCVPHTRWIWYAKGRCDYSVKDGVLKWSWADQGSTISPTVLNAPPLPTWGN